MSSSSKPRSTIKKPSQSKVRRKPKAKPSKSRWVKSYSLAPRVVVVDDHEVILSAVSLANQKAFGKVPDGQCNTIEELEKILKSSGANVVILDLMLGEEDVRPHIPKLIKTFPETRFLILSSLTNPKQIAEVIRLGVHGFVHKSHSVETIALAIQEVWLKGRYLCSRATSALMEAMQKNPNEDEADRRLTNRESQLLKALAQGSNIKQASETLGICEKTAYTHRAALLRKTGTLDNVGLVCYAIRQGLVDIPRRES